MNLQQIVVFIAWLAALGGVALLASGAISKVASKASAATP